MGPRKKHLNQDIEIGFGIKSFALFERNCSGRSTSRQVVLPDYQEESSTETEDHYLLDFVKLNIEEDEFKSKDAFGVCRGT